MVERRLRPLHSPTAAIPAEPPSARPEPPSAAIVPTDQTAADLRSALTILSPDGYDLWYRMGLALKCLGDAGLSLWLEWSARSPKFNEREALAKWASFQPAATGFRAVFAEAQRQGWENPNRHPNAGVPIVEAVAARTFTTNGQAWTFSFGTNAQLATSVAPLAFPAVTLNEWLSAKPSPPPIVPGHFYADVGVFVAPGGTGKTTSVLWQAVHIALGRDLWGMPVLRPGPVMVLTAEDSRELLVARLRLICAELALTDEQTQLVAQRVRIGDVSGTGFRLTQIELQEAFEVGRERERHALHNMLYRQAMEKGNATAAMFLLKSRHGYREGDQAESANKVSINFQLPAPIPLADFRVIEHGNSDDRAEPVSTARALPARRD